MKVPTLCAAKLRVGGPGQPRLHDVDLTLHRGLTVLVGPNGSGKTTLLRALLGLEAPSSGDCTLDGRPIHQLTPRQRAAHLAWLPQDPPREDGLTAREAVAAARFRFDEPWPVALSAADHALAAHRAHDLADRPMDALSGGEAQRVRLAALQAQEASWWLLDEPGNHLDAAVQLDLLARLRARALTAGVLLVTHDLTLLPHLPDARVIALRGGTVALDRPVGDPALPAELGGLFGLDLVAVPVDGGTRWLLRGAAVGGPG